MINNVKIRMVKERDIDQIYKIGMATKAFSVSKKVRFYSKRELRKIIKSKNNFIMIIAEKNSRVIGFILFRATVDYAYIDNIAIIPEFRHKGIVTLLIKKCIDIIKRYKITYIFTSVRLDYQKPKRFWKKMGFREGYKFIWMEKFLR